MPATDAVDTLNDLRLSPAQVRAAQSIVERVEGIRTGARGQIIFLAGEEGAGRSHLLRWIERELQTRDGEFRVARGGLSLDRSAEESEWLKRAEALVTNAASAASALDPSFALVGPIAGFSVASAGLLRTMSDPRLTPTELVTRVLRTAARDSSEPLICLVDDADWLGGAWWTELQFSFAKEVVDQLQMALVFVLDEGRETEAPDQGERRLAQIAHVLGRRGLAEWVHLAPLTAEELREWLGPAPRSATAAAHELSGGRSGDAAEIWRTWLSDGVLSQEADGGNAPADETGILDHAATRFAADLDANLSDPSQMETLREALALGALEGRTFTGAAVATALGRDHEELEDLLDDLTEDTSEDGPLLEPRSVVVHNLSRGGSQILWRYEFSSRLYWLVARERFSDLPPGDLASDLLDALLETYDHETAAIAPALARLAEVAGRPAEAARFRSLATMPARRAVLAEQARNLLIADQTGWTPLDHRDASKLLARTAMGLWTVKPVSVLLPFAAHAVEHAKKAGEQGNRAMAMALLSESRLLLRGGEVDLAEEKLESARKRVADGAPIALAEVLRGLSEVVETRDKDFDRCTELLKEASLIYQRNGSRIGESVCHYERAGIAAREKDYPTARALTEKARTMMRDAGDHQQEMVALFQLADIEHLAGNYEPARDYLAEALRYHAGTGDVNNEAACLRLLGRIELKLGRPEKALGPAEAALAAEQRLQSRRGEAPALRTLGQISAALGDAPRGRELMQKAIEGYRALGNEERAAAVQAELQRLQGKGQ